MCSSWPKPLRYFPEPKHFSGPRVENRVAHWRPDLACARSLIGSRRSRIVGLADATPTKESCRARLNGRRELQTRWMVARVVPFSDDFLAFPKYRHCNGLR